MHGIVCYFTESILISSSLLDNASSVKDYERVIART